MTDSRLFRFGAVGLALAVAVVAVLVFVAPVLENDDDAADSNADNSAQSVPATDTNPDADRLNDAFSSGNNSLDTAGNRDTTTFDPFAPIRVELAPQTVAPGQGTLLIEVNMPDGYKLNALAPLQARLASDSSAVEISDLWANFAQETPPLPLEVPLTFNPGQSALTGEMTIYWCEAINEELCFIDNAELVIPVVVDDTATSSEMTATVNLVPPEL